MSYRVIQKFDADFLFPLEVEGRSIPACCMVEDDDGIRILIVPGAPMPEDRIVIPSKLWVDAAADGVALLVTEIGGYWAYMRTEDFISARHENKADASFWIEPTMFDITMSPPEWRYLQTNAVAKMLEEDAIADEKDRWNPTSFVHLHCHSEFSPLDGLSTIDELVALAVEDGQPALGISDHGVCAAHPFLAAACKKAGIKPVFALEAYLVHDRFARSKPKPKASDWMVLIPGERVWDGATNSYITTPEKAELNQAGYDQECASTEDYNKQARDYYHVTLVAQTQQGLLNLWAASTEANREGFYGKPRLDWDTLQRFNEGIICATGCLRGPLPKEFLLGNEEQALMNLGRLQAIFEDRLYLEVHTNQLPEQIKVNRWLADLGELRGIPMIAASDAHYPKYADKTAHATWIATQTNSDLMDEAELFAGDTSYHLMQAREVRQYLHYLGEDVVAEAIANTVRIAASCTADIAAMSSDTPMYHRMGTDGERRQKDFDLAIETCLANWGKTRGKQYDQDVYEARFEEEVLLLTSKGFWGYFLMNWAMTSFAKKNGILVGPGRGSGGGCLVAYLMGITEIDPVDADLLFARFLTEGRKALPDFDIDYPASKRDVMTQFCIDNWGSENVVRVGSVVRSKNKGIIKDLARALKSTIDDPRLFVDMEAVSKIIEEAEGDKAGLGMSWEDLWVEHEEVLAPYRKRYPFLFEMADALVGRVKSYGRHAAGLVISPDAPLTGRLPLRLAGEQLVCEFDKDVVEEVLHLIKFDLLTIRTLDTIQECVDLIRTRRGREINVYEWLEEYQDPQVWEEISDGHTLGIFQIETSAGTKLTRRFRPTSIHELADVITLVRPGPKRSGLTDTYFRRREGEESVSFPDERLEKVLSKTYGCILYQEDVMATCMTLAHYTSDEADGVRKILGKKKVEEAAKAGEKFVTQAVQFGMDRTAAQVLWDQMAEFAKYSFNRAHAFGYAVLGYWCAWLKFHYPQEFLTALLSTMDDKKRIPEFINEARRMGYQVLPPDINQSGKGFKVGENLTIRYGLDAVKGVGEVAVAAIVANQPYTSYDDFLERKTSKCDMGVVRLLASVGAFDTLVENRKALEAKLTWEHEGGPNQCIHKEVGFLGPEGLPCHFDWSSEPVKLGKKGQPLKSKPLPKKCSKACRQFVAPTFDERVIHPYSTDEIRDRELELLGVYLSSTPFDRIPEDVLEECVDADDVENGPSGEYVVAGIVSAIRKREDKQNREFAFVNLTMPGGKLDLVCFNSQWEGAGIKSIIRPQLLCFAVVKKTDRGSQLVSLVSLD